MNKSFLVTFELPVPMTEEFAKLIPATRKIIDKLMLDRKIGMFAVSEDRTQAWSIIRAEDQGEVREIVNRFPLIRLMSMKLSELSWLNSPVFAPAISLN
jgi:hypothetical protein